MSDPAPLVVVGSANSQLGNDVCRQLGLAPASCTVRRFPDGEIQVELRESVRNRDVFVVQPTSPPVADHLLELLLIADASRRAGARRVVAVIPYLGYARQDRRSGRQSLGASVVARSIETGRFDRVILVDVHTPAVEGFFDTPIEHLTAVPLLARALQAEPTAGAIVVAPDLGAVKRARTFCNLLSLPLAVVQKTRLSGEEVEASSAIGPLAGRAPIIVDDMLSTGGTVAAAVQAVLAAGARGPVSVAVSHGLLAGKAVEVLRQLPLGRVLVTDSVAAVRHGDMRLEVVSLAPLLATAISRLHSGRSLHELQAPA